MLGRADPLAADLDDLIRVVADRVVEGAPADAVARLEDDDVEPRRLEIARGGQPREAGADDDDVVIGHGLEYPAKRVDHRVRFLTPETFYE